eukprot:TRINITY_DN4032_c0_g1_i1.p1 TRINITY_DN4032_c0_g1~~TRINITY_DN4032_c0_g1_i1.p1  ORF type:complete len:239 (+),score=47.48 TRINITY_DN4032_c0_g1_i1:440-1156(+)
MFSLIRYSYKTLTLSEHCTLTLLGLDGAGKSCFANSVRMLFGMEGAERIFPTTGQAIAKGYPKPRLPGIPRKIEFSIVDVSGKPGYRKFWVQQYKSTHGIVWLVDTSSAGQARWEESARELHKVLLDKKLDNTMVCIVGSKMDLSSSGETSQGKSSPRISDSQMIQELASVFGVEEISRTHLCKVALSKCPVTPTRETHQGPEDVLLWVAQNLVSTDPRVMMRKDFIEAHKNDPDEDI